jgi:hypothetical protein
MKYATRLRQLEKMVGPTRGAIIAYEEGGLWYEDKPDPGQGMTWEDLEAASPNKIIIRISSSMNGLRAL